MVLVRKRRSTVGRVVEAALAGKPDRADVRQTVAMAILEVIDAFDELRGVRFHTHARRTTSQTV